MTNPFDPRLLGWTLSAGAAIALFTACPSEGRRPIGASCDSDGQCQTGLCLEDTCLDPTLDDDSDGLTNGLEGQLKTNPLVKDSDSDGRDDAAEVGTTTAPTDFDGDQKIDAIESDKTDSDSDCLVDQRDPDDHTPTHDPAVLGELGCCCAGHCAAGATAACQEGHLVCSTPEADRDGDGTPDTCDSPALSLTPTEATKVCTTACEHAATDCPDLTRPTDCASTCAGLAVREGLWAANYACMTVACNAADTGPCFGAAGDFGEPSECAGICHNLAACGGLSDLEIDSEPECRAVCAGALQAQPAGELAAFLHCVGTVTLPAGTCHSIELAQCTDPNFACDVACRRLDPTSPEVCPAGAPIFGIWPDLAACMNTCKARGGFGRAAFLGCVGMTGCSTPRDACTTVPATIAPAGCGSLCEHVASKCPGPPWDDPTLCGAVCTGLAQVATWMDPGAAEALACVDAAPSCPAEDGGPMALAVGCAVNHAPGCAELCSRASACQIAIPGTVSCERQCASITLSVPEQAAAVIDCVSKGGDCKSTQACLTRIADVICPRACSRVAECDPNFPGGADGCREQCVQQVTAHPDGYGRWTCEAVAAGCGVDCTTTAGPPEACVTACAGSDACVEKGYAMCLPACRGILLANGPTTNAACVVEHLGRACDIFDMSACVTP